MLSSLKRCKTIAVVILFLFVLIGCGQEKAETNILAEKYYNTGSYVVKFESDNVVTIVRYELYKDKGVTNTKTYYATYSVEESALTITYSGENYTGVILDDGERLAFGDSRLNLCEIEGYSEKVRNAFGLE